MFWKKNIEKAPGITHGKSTIHGIGVFALMSFKKGAVIEQAPLILLGNSEREQLQNTALFDYYFLIGNDKTPVALGLGMASLYNHAVNSNAVYNIDLKKEVLIIKANQAIKVGEEITINYNGKAGDNRPVFFKKEQDEQAVVS